MNFAEDALPANRLRYRRMVERATQNSALWLHVLRAFAVGGALCLLAQGILLLLTATGLDKESAGTVTTMAMIALGVVSTGFGVYDKLYTFGGAGAAVPVTGFANSVSAPAMEFKKEGWITGTGAKMFSLAGPVLIYGVSAATLVGILAWIVEARL